MPVPIISGYEEIIAHIRELPNASKEELRQVLGCDVAVGFIYKCDHVMGLPIWTSNGRHVLYRGKEYWEPKDPAVWAQLLGEDQSLGKPFSYYFPVGWWVIGSVIGWVVAGLFFYNRYSRQNRNDLERANQLLEDDRYQQAVRLKSFDDSVAFLHGKGVSETEAEVNLRFLLGVAKRQA